MRLQVRFKVEVRDENAPSRGQRKEWRDEFVRFTVSVPDAPIHEATEYAAKLVSHRLGSLINTTIDLGEET
jgi:hypothetical protein